MTGYGEGKLVLNLCSILLYSLCWFTLNSPVSLCHIVTCLRSSDHRWRLAVKVVTHGNQGRGGVNAVEQNDDNCVLLASACRYAPPLPPALNWLDSTLPFPSEPDYDITVAPHHSDSKSVSLSGCGTEKPTAAESLLLLGGS